MRLAPSVLLLAALMLAGCDRITGEAARKTYDAEAIGYACRVSLKTPEECMKENEAYSPTSVLSGWKAANKDIENNLIDPTMGKDRKMEIQPQSAPAAQSEPAAAETAAEAAKAPAAKDAKPAAKPVKPEKH